MTPKGQGRSASRIDAVQLLPVGAVTRVVLGAVCYSFEIPRARRGCIETVRGSRAFQFLIFGCGVDKRHTQLPLQTSVFVDWNGVTGDPIWGSRKRKKVTREKR